MKLDRNINGDGRGKYALLRLRQLDLLNSNSDRDPKRRAVNDAIRLLETVGLLDFGDKPEAEFFVMRLKDKHAYKGLMGYYNDIVNGSSPDLEYAQEILDMTRRAGPNSPFCKEPD